MLRRRTKAEKISCTIRCLISLALTYGVYTEAGIWTSISVLLIFIWSEAETWNKEVRS